MADRGRSGTSTDRSRGEPNEFASHSQQVSPAHGITEEVEQKLSNRDAKNSPEKQAKTFEAVQSGRGGLRC